MVFSIVIEIDSRFESHGTARYMPGAIRNRRLIVSCPESASESPELCDSSRNRQTVSAIQKSEDETGPMRHEEEDEPGSTGRREEEDEPGRTMNPRKTVNKGRR